MNINQQNYELRDEQLDAVVGGKTQNPATGRIDTNKDRRKNPVTGRPETR